MKYWIISMVASWVPLWVTAAPLIETYGRAEINWGTLKVRFYGESTQNISQSDDYEVVHKAAWDDGMAYLSDQLPELRSKKGCWSVTDDAEQRQAMLSFQDVARSTYSVITSLFAVGALRIKMESSLVKALYPPQLALAEGEVVGEGANHSGVIFVLSQRTSPCPTYQLVDNTGSVLFRTKDVAKSAFEKNFMARWFRRPSPREVRRYVGDNPIRVPVSIDEQGRFRMEKSHWEGVVEANVALLSAAKVVVSTP